MSETGLINGTRPAMPGRGEGRQGFAESAAAVEISLAFGQGGGAGAEAEQPFSVGYHATPPSPCPT